MEKVLMEEFENYCKYRCKYKDCKYNRDTIKIENSESLWIMCDECDHEMHVSTDSVTFSPCDYCQIEGFIKEIRDIL